MGSPGRFERLAANIRFNAYGQALQALLPFFAIPFVIHRLGKESYAIYALLGVLTGQLNLLNFGAGPATVKYLAEFGARPGEEAKSERMLGTSFAFYSAVGLIGAALLWGLAPVLATRVLEVSAPMQPAARFLVVCAGWTFLLQSLGRAFQAVPQAMHRFDWWNGAESAASLLNYAGLFALLGLGYGVRALGVWTIVVAAFTAVLYFALSRRLLPAASFRPRLDGEMLRLLLRFGGILFVANILWSVQFQLDKLVAAAYVPAADAAYYIVAFGLAQKLLLLIQPVLPSLLPFSSDLYGSGDEAKARRFHLSGTKAAAILLLPGAVLGFFFAPAFLELWLGGDFSLHGGWVLRWLILTFAFAGIPVVAYGIAQGAGKLEAPTAMYALAVLGSAAAWLAVLPRHGLVGMAAVTCAGQTLYALALLVWCTRSLLGLSFRDMLRGLWPPFAIALPLIAASLALRNSLKDWLSLAAFGASGLALYWAGCYRWALDDEERGRVRMIAISRP